MDNTGTNYKITGFQELGIETRELNKKALDSLINFYCNFIINYFNDFSQFCGESLNQTIYGTKEEVAEVLLDEDDLIGKSRQERNLLKNKIKHGKHKKFFIQVKKNIESSILNYNKGLESLKDDDGNYNFGELINYSLKQFDTEYFADEIKEMRKMTTQIKELLAYIIIKQLKSTRSGTILKKIGIEHDGNFDMEKIESAISVISLYGFTKIKHWKNIAEENVQESANAKNELKEISYELERLKQEKILSEKDKRTLSKALSEKEESLKSANSQINGYRQINSNLTGELEKERERNESLEKENSRLSKGITISGNHEDWENIAMELDIENTSLKDETQRLGETIEKHLRQIQLLENKISIILEEGTNELKLLRFKVENELEKCNNDEIIKYITYSNTSIGNKQELVNIITKFLGQFSQDVTKGASSSTNINISHKKGEGVGIGSGRYANKFINPFLNFLEQKRINYGTIGYLEYMTDLNLINFIGEYRSGDVTTVSNKKDSVMLRVYNSINEQGFSEINGITNSLEMLAIVFENIDHGDLDLSLLSENIKNSLNKQNFRKELELLLSKIK